MEYDTVFAPITAKGKAGMSAIRISGPLTARAINHLGINKIQPRNATHKTIYSKSGQIIDRAIVIWFPAPKSFTGFDTLEIQIHGSPAIMKILISELQNIPGLRIAKAGEFTKMALLNNKINLLQAESIADLINAETEQQHKQAMNQLLGKSNIKYQKWRSQLISAAALVETYLDFPEEDIPDHIAKQINTTLQTLKEDIHLQINSAKQNLIIKNGFNIVIIGEPNVGKSTLINYLAAKDIAIVSNIPGTTRDTVEANLNINGYAINITDTAGLRQKTDNTIEQEGIKRTQQKAESADLIIAMFDYNKLPTMDKYTLDVATKEPIFVASKADSCPKHLIKNQHNTLIPISTTKNFGINNLLEEIQQKINNHTCISDSIITSQRHKQNVHESYKIIQDINLLNEPIEITAEKIRTIIALISEITGHTTNNEEILDKIFSQFCIGK